MAKLYLIAKTVAIRSLDNPSTGAQRETMTRASKILAGGFSVALLFATSAAAAAPDVASGKKKFDGLCVQCHRADAEGMNGMGMDLQTAPLVKDGSLAAIAKFIATGHTPTKEFPLGMPPNGGESLSDADRTDIAAYLKTLAK